MRDNAEWTPGTVIALICGIVFWVVLLRWYGRTNSRYPDRPASIPIALIPVGYLLLQINPLIEYLLYRMNLRRSQRIRSFLELADDLRMRKHRIDRALPPGSGS